MTVLCVTAGIYHIAKLTATRLPSRGSEEFI